MNRFHILLALLLTGTSLQAQPYTNLALEGGGIRGMAYAGAYRVLEERGLVQGIRNVAGTSVGAAVASLISVDYSAQELKTVMDGLRVQTFNDGGGALLGGQYRLRKQYGWYRGEALERWVDDRLAAKTGIHHLTFRMLHERALREPAFKDLYVTASNISAQRLAVFSWKSCPDMEIATAVRTSMSVPLYFRAVCLDSAGHKAPRDQGDWFADGGLILNYPLAIFDSGGVQAQTLGFKLERPEQIEGYRAGGTGIAPYQITNFRSYVGALYNLTIETMARTAPMEQETRRTIYISTAGIAPKVRRMTQAEKDRLFQSGQDAAIAFFETKR